MLSSRFFKFHALPGMLILLMALGLVSSSWAQTDIGQVNPGGNRSTIPIAVPPFQAIGGQALSAPTLLSDVIASDLKLSGFFSMPANEQFARETNQLDLQKGAINFAEWVRIGVSYLVKGTYKIQGSDLVTEVKTFDTVSQKYVFGKRYENYKISEARLLAHRISNDIIERLVQEKGIAGTQIVFVRANDRLGNSKQVYVMDADGQNVQALTEQGELVATPCWGARGTELYYTTYRDYNPDLRGVILRSHAKWWVSRRPSLNISPAWSEKQKLITLVLAKDGNSELYTINREGKELRRLTTNRSIDCSPAWSPDGTQIAFTSDRTGNQQIYIMDVRTLEVRRLTYQGSYNDGASWAPCGSNRIAYASRVDGIFQIMTIKPDGSDPQQITNGSSHSEDPSWAPNGWTMSFTSDRSGQKQIYSMFADGSNLQQLTHGGQSQSSNWSPEMP